MEDIVNIKTKEWRKLSYEERNYARGLWGEYALNRALNDELGAVRFGEHADGHSVFLFDRVHIPSYGGNTTEIDSVLVSQKGVFCFEVKSWSGDAVFGERDGSKWFTVKGGSGSGLRHHRIGNPFKQNDFHVRYLEKLLPPIVADKALYGLVLFINASPFGIKPGNWAGSEIKGLFTDVDSIIELINNAPCIMSGSRVYEVSRILSQYSFGNEFRLLGN